MMIATLICVCLLELCMMKTTLGAGKRCCRLRLIAGASLLVLAALPLAGCQTMSSDSLLTGSTGTISLKQTASAAKRWEADPGNAKLALQYINLLKEMGQSEKAMSVFAEVSKRNPQDYHLMTIYGKELAAAGRGEDAIGVLRQVAESGKADWKVHSALGMAYDQQGEFTDARASYQAALAAKPGDVSVLNNLGMSYALEGNLPEAEKTLRQAAAQTRGADAARLRQNLALVVGLQGRFDEAKAIISKDLPANEVEANMAYLKTMLAQPDPWQQLKQTAKNG
jgi:Flp pilus assembly protein TadD